MPGSAAPPTVTSPRRSVATRTWSSTAPCWRRLGTASRRQVLERRGAAPILSRGKAESMARKGKKKRDPASGDVATNRRARHKFEWIERVEAGMVLRGSEVKSLRNGKAQMTDAYAVINDGEVWLR